MEGPVAKASMEQMRSAVGREMGVSNWTLIDQAMVDAFAKLTGDTYFIHTDPERAKRETPFGGTIVHGFFTTSLLANMAYQACPWIEGTKTGVNYGFNRLRYVSPVPTGSRVRGRFVLKSFDVQPSRWQTVYEVSVEIEGAAKPALVAEWVGAGLI
jgi:acyl dehydratase